MTRGAKLDRFPEGRNLRIRRILPKRVTKGIEMYSNPSNSPSNSGVRPRGRHIAHWLVRYDGATLGPVTLARLEEWIRARLVPRHAELGLVGCDEWVPLKRALPCVKPEIPAEPLSEPEPAMTSLFDDMDDEEEGITQVKEVTRPAADRWKRTVIGWSPPAG